MKNGSVEQEAPSLRVAPKPRSSRTRKLLRKLHLYVGVLTGPIVLIVSLTGCLWVFQAELQSLFGEERNVEPKEAPMIGPMEAKEVGMEVFPDRRTLGSIYGDPDEALELVFHEENPEFYRSVFLDPYSGEVLGTEDHTSGFFTVVLAGHMHLWLPEWIGESIVSWGVLLFFLSLLSGLILWWPRHRKERKKRFKLNLLHWRNLKQKRFDLHAVVGFYAFVFALIFAITGLSMSFDWFSEALHKGMGGERTTVFRTPEALSEGKGASSIEELPALLQRRYPEAESFEVHYPQSDEQAIYVELSKEEGVYYNNDYRFFDPETLEELPPESIYGPYEEASLPDRILRMEYDIHVGSILGLPGKILAFFSSLTIGSLPVTGALLWWVRRKKKKRTRQRKARRILFRTGKERGSLVGTG